MKTNNKSEPHHLSHLQWAGLCRMTDRQVSKTPYKVNRGGNVAEKVGVGTTAKLWVNTSSMCLKKTYTTFRGVSVSHGQLFVC